MFYFRDKSTKYLDHHLKNKFHSVPITNVKKVVSIKICNL